MRRRSSSKLNVMASRHVSPPPPGTARDEKSPDSTAFAARASAATGREIHQLASASRPIRTTAAPSSTRRPHCARLKKAPSRKNGSATRREPSSIHVKKLSQGFRSGGAPRFGGGWAGGSL